MNENNIRMQANELCISLCEAFKERNLFPLTDEDIDALKLLRKNIKHVLAFDAKFKDVTSYNKEWA